MAGGRGGGLLPAISFTYPPSLVCLTFINMRRDIIMRPMHHVRHPPTLQAPPQIHQNVANASISGAATTLRPALSIPTMSILRDSLRNRGMAFTAEERTRHGIAGLLPAVGAPPLQWTEVVCRSFDQKPTDVTQA